MQCGSLDGRGVWRRMDVMYMYSRIPLLFTCNHYNIVNQLYPQYKIKSLKRKKKGVQAVESVK